MTPFTLIMPYYDNPGMLKHHIGAWLALPKDLRKLLHVKIIDDGSPRLPAEPIARERLNDLTTNIASFELYRMGVDVPWNQDACRNVGAHHTSTSWMLMTDIDHVVAEATWRRVMFGSLDKLAVYRFGRVSAPGMQPYKHHPNSWAVTKETFWRSGGYDEALAGYYGTDGDFGRRLVAVSRLKDLKEVLIRYPREVIADASTTTLQRKKPEDKAEIYRIVKGRQSGWQARVLSFPYARVL